MVMNMKMIELNEDSFNVFLSFFKILNEESTDMSFDNMTEEKLFAWLHSDHELIYGYEEGGKVVSVLKGKRGFEHKFHSVFLSAATLKSYRNKGLAAKLTEEGLVAMKPLGIKIARAYIYSDNTASVSTILKCGFTAAGCVHMHHIKEDGRIIDDLIFHRVL